MVMTEAWSQIKVDGKQAVSLYPIVHNHAISFPRYCLTLLALHPELSELLPFRLTGCPRNIPDFPAHVTITKYLTQSDKPLHANQPITAMDVHNIIHNQEFIFFIGLEGT